MPEFEEVERLMRQALMAHLSEEELAEYYDGIVSEVTRARIEAHLKRCLICSRKWELMRGMLDAYYREPSVHPVLRALPKVLPDYAINWARQQGLQFAYGAWAGAERIECSGQVLEGALRWRIEEDDLGNLVVKIGSHITDLQGVTLEVGIANLSKRVKLEIIKGAEDQVGAKVCFSIEERKRIPKDAEFYINVVEPSSESECGSTGR